MPGSIIFQKSTSKLLFQLFEIHLRPILPQATSVWTKELGHNKQKQHSSLAIIAGSPAPSLDILGIPKMYLLSGGSPVLASAAHILSGGNPAVETMVSQL